MKRIPSHAARYAATAWELHWVSFRYYMQQVFPDRCDIRQAAIVVRTLEEAKALKVIHPAGKVHRMGGWDQVTHKETSLWVVAPWLRDRFDGLTGVTHALNLLMDADGSNLESLAFQVHTEFDFVCDSMVSANRNLQGIFAMMVRSWGWTEVPGVREAMGSIGASGGQPRPENFPYLS